MKSRLIYSILILGFSGCCSSPGDFRSKMESAALVALPTGVQQTRFAYIGEIHTTKGTYHVVEQRLILKDMLSPHEASHLLLFSDDARLIAGYQPDFGSELGFRALWCECSRVYLFGYSSLHFDDSINHAILPDSRLNQLFLGTGQAPTGNVIDFDRGPKEPFLTREKRYGSSGGLEDGPWQLP